MSNAHDPTVPDRNLALELVRVTESAAMGAARWIGRGDKNAADGAAVDLMRRMINTVTMQGVVVIGEGEKDEAPMLFNRERVGAGFGPEVDVAVDPLEGTRLTALGIPGSISVIAVAERGSMFFPGAALYMEKIAVGPEAAGAIDLNLSPTENVRAVAAAKGMRVSDLTVVVLERERHETLIEELRASGARVNLIRDGDVAPSIAACQPFTGIDLLMGIGGTPEGVISAAAIKCMGGAIQGRLWPRNDGERTALVEGGFDLDRVLTADDLVAGDDVFVAATGVTGGSLLRGVRTSAAGVETESIVMRSRSGTVRRIAAYHPNDKLANLEREGMMAWEELYATARAIVADDKGILAADESTGTIVKRFDGIGVESTEDTRRSYRNLLLTAAGMEEFIGGVILYDETIRQRADDGTPFAELLAAKGVVPGIKVDTGAKPLALHPGETVTEGLDGLRGRLEEYYALGARFAKWRAVITIGDGIPTDACLEANAHALARYAALCQEAGLIPIVEPEVLMDADNSIEVCDDVTGRTLRAVYAALYAFDVHLRGTLLKPNMVIAGKGCAVQDGAERIAALTVHNLLRHVPALVPGVVFLSGGQSEVQATENLNEINRIGGAWPLSYSYGRALQASALAAWRGDPANVGAAQAEFLHRARMNSLAVAGRWSAELEQTVTRTSG